MPETDKPSKTRRKKAMHELQALGDELVALSVHQLASMDLPAGLHEAVLEARIMTKHEARRRQMQYIGRLMRDVDPAPIREQLAVWQGQSRVQTQRLHEIERWRERLLADDSALTEFAMRYGGASLQALRVCLRAARREQSAGQHFRELFRLIRDVISKLDIPAGGAA